MSRSSRRRAFVTDLEPVRLRLDGGHLRLQQDLLVELADALRERRDDVRIGPRHQLVHHLDHGDPGAERMIDRRHLEPDDPSAEHQHALGDEIDLERPGRIPDAGVGGNESRRGGFGAGGDDRLVEAHDPRALGGFDAQGVGRSELALPGHGLDLALLGKADQAARQPLDHAVLPAANRRRVEGRRAEAHAVRTHRLGVVDDLGDMQQRLGRDAADVETDAAERRSRVDQNDVLPEISGAESGGVAAGTGAQNQNIGLEIGLSAGISSGLRRGPAARPPWSRLLDFDAAALGAGRRRGFGRWRRGAAACSSPAAE